MYYGFVIIAKIMNKNIWIIKPGENTNRGFGIQIIRNLEDIIKVVSETDYNSELKRTLIIQRYIDNPLLIYRRKFDIRMYGLITSINGFIKGYYYEEGYIRTSSKEYSLKNLNKKDIHLTNDAIQCLCEDYGKYEIGNNFHLQNFKNISIAIIQI